MTMRVLIHAEAFHPFPPTAWIEWTRQLFADYDEELLRIVVEARFEEQVRAEIGQDLAACVRKLDTEALHAMGVSGTQRLLRTKLGPPGDIVRETLSRSLSTCLGDWRPDIVISWAAPAQLFEDAFGSVPVVFMEVGQFARPPFKPTLFMDPCGLSGSAVLDRFPELLSDPSIEGHAILDFNSAVRAGFASAVARSNPFDGFIKRARQKFSHLALLPLTVWPNPMAAEYIPFETQIELVLEVARRLPEDWGLIITQHPFAPPIEGPLAAWLNDHTSNLIIAPKPIGAAGMVGIGPSDFLASDVDAIINPTSKVAALALLCCKPLISLSDDNLNLVSDGIGLDSIKFLPKGRTSVNNNLRERALYWLLTRYNVSIDAILENNLLQSRLNAVVTGAPKEVVYSKFSSDEQILWEILKGFSNSKLIFISSESIESQPPLMNAFSAVNFERIGNISTDHFLPIAPATCFRLCYGPLGPRLGWIALGVASGCNDNDHERPAISAITHGPDGMIVVYLWTQQGGFAALNSRSEGRVNSEVDLVVWFLGHEDAAILLVNGVVEAYAMPPAGHSWKMFDCVRGGIHIAPSEKIESDIDLDGIWIGR